MTINPFNLQIVDASWRTCLEQGLASMDSQYLNTLSQAGDWLPGHNAIFNAFTLPMNQTNYVLFGESPYPRQESANGYAFWDGAVRELWSAQGLSKKVNRATSLRNILKMLLVAEGLLQPDNTSQTAIAELDKSRFVQTNDAFFQNLIKHGFLLLNATPVLQSGSPTLDAKAWHPFVATIIKCLLKSRPQVQFILLGKIANNISPLLAGTPNDILYAEHPYNLSFIQNKKVINFFKPLHLLIS